jgi:hypothetical protein
MKRMHEEDGVPLFMEDVSINEIIYNFFQKLKKNEGKKMSEVKKKSNVKLVDAITIKAFVGFVSSLILLFLMDFGDQFEWKFSNKVFKFVFYIIVVAFLIISEVDRPALTAFMSKTFELIFDNRLTDEQKVSMMSQFGMSFMGYWADLSKRVNEKKNETEKIE